VDQIHEKCNPYYQNERHQAHVVRVKLKTIHTADMMRLLDYHDDAARATNKLSILFALCYCQQTDSLFCKH